MDLRNCSRCGEAKPLDSFAPNRNGRNGLHAYCRPCESDRHREWYRKKKADPEWDAERKRRNRENARKLRARNPEKLRDNELRKRYGVSYDNYCEIRRAQADRCATCRERLAGGRKEHLDHSHATGAVRGILCNNCNLALGHVRDNVDVLGAMIGYLSRHG